MPTSHRSASAGLLLVVSLAALAGCSDGVPVARDTAPTTAPTSTLPSPTAAPTTGSYPDYEPTDYEFTLTTSCFCAENAPVRIVVAGDEVVSAVFLPGDDRGRGSAEPGTAAPDYRQLTIDDVIAAANDTEAAQVDVDWPEGQPYPTSVYVDQDTRMADEEIGYTVSDVVVG